MIKSNLMMWFIILKNQTKLCNCVVKVGERIEAIKHIIECDSEIIFLGKEYISNQIFNVNHSIKSSFNYYNLSGNIFNVLHYYFNSIVKLFSFSL